MEPTWILHETRGTVSITIRLYGPVTGERLEREHAVLRRRLEQLS